jgi:hypothetical protein
MAQLQGVRVGIADCYARAVSSKNLASKPETTFSDSDVLAAAGIASRAGSALGVALMRMLLGGDNRAAAGLARILVSKTIGKAYRLGVEITHQQAQAMASAVVEWHKDSACKVCGGHGVLVIPGTRSLGDEICGACGGSGRVAFAPGIATEHRQLAAWLSSEMDRELAFAGPATMRALSDLMD